MWLVRTLILQNHTYTLQWGQIESKGAFSYPAVFSRDILSSVVLKKQIECLKNFVKTLIHRNKYAPSQKDFHPIVAQAPVVNIASING